MADNTHAAPKPGRLRVGIIGSGRVGPQLARTLAGAGHTISGITATGDAARERVEAILPGVTVKTIPELLASSELVVFAIPGTELPELVRGLTTQNLWQPGQLLVHTAPEHGHSVFAPATAQSAIGLAIHPAIVFTGTSLDTARLADAQIAVTAPAPVLPIAQALALELGGEPVIVADEDRPGYADALQAGTEMLQAVVAQTLRGLRHSGIAAPHRVATAQLETALAEALRVTDETPFDSPADLDY